MAFLNISTGLTLEEFERYVAAYEFGAMPPTGIVLHHTARPTFGQWTEVPNTYESRKRRLDNIARYYQSLGWSRGPHLFIDDQWVWLMTPMYEQGIHAAEGNGAWINNVLHYSIGIEVVGDYTHQQWPDAVGRMVGGAVAILHEHLGTFELDWRAGGRTFAHHTRRISSHRDYNKPSCPGDAITEDYYLDVLRREHARYVQARTAAPLPVLDGLQPGTFVLRHPGTVRRGASRNAPIVATFHDIGAHIDIAEWVRGERVGLSTQWGLLASPEWQGCYLHSSAFGI